MSDVMKLGQVYFSWLPAHVVAKWHDNVENEDFKQTLLNTEFDSLYSFISHSFQWHNSPEGFEYWLDVAQIDWKS
jgi:hypothetical protein